MEKAWGTGYDPVSSLSKSEVRPIRRSPNIGVYHYHNYQRLGGPKGERSPTSILTGLHAQPVHHRTECAY
jgi:hypothetical protein